MKWFLFLATSIVMLFTACNKDDDDDKDPAAITKENLSASYVFVSAKGKFGLFEQDISNNEDFIPACTKDDVLTLKTDFTFTSQDAGVACNPNGSYSGTWSLPNTSTIVIDGETFTILSFDGRNLQLSYTFETDVIPGVDHVDIVTNFRKQ